MPDDGHGDAYAERAAVSADETFEAPLPFGVSVVPSDLLAH